MLGRRLRRLGLTGAGVLLAACTEKHIEGTVQSPFGEPLERVEVNVVNSQFTASTNRAGQYSLAYAPGQFTLRFSKPGFTTHTLDLNVQQLVRYPAAPVVMYPIPEQPGLYEIGDRALVALAPAKVEVLEQRDTSTPFGSTRITHFAGAFLEEPGRGRVALPPGAATFVDRLEQHVQLVRLDPNGVIDRSDLQLGGRKYLYDDKKQDGIEKAGEQQLLLRHVELTPGDYAWVTMARTLLGEVVVDDSGLCYPFRVEGSVQHAEGQTAKN
jgi:hypothetical protein